ncbi:MAG: PAS domain-containing protein [Bacillota bacterium]
MDTEVFLRGENVFKEVSITSIIKPELSDKFLNKWQKIVNLLSEMIDVPTALIMKINEDNMEVLLKNKNKENPYEIGDKEPLGSGLYCETVIGKNQKLSIDNALNYEKWRDNPDVKLNMISYYGLPIKWPDNDIFGTICVLDNKTKNLEKNQKDLLEKFKNVIEDDLELLISKEELKKQKRLFQKLLNYSLEGIILMDEGFKVIKANSQFEVIFGYKKGEIIGKNIIDFIIPVNEKKNFLKHKKEVLSGKDIETVVKRKTKSGEIRLISLNLFRVKLTNKKFGVYAVYNDITRKKKREKTLKDIKEKLTIAVKGANIGVWDWNLKTDEVYYNQKWANMLDYDLKELENNIETWKNLVYEKDKEAIEEKLNNHLNGNTELYKSEYRLITKSGKLKWIKDIGKVTERNKKGDPVRMVGIHIDIDKKYSKK